MKKRTIITTVVALVVLAAIFGIRLRTVSKILADLDAKVVPPVTVAVADTRAEEWPNSLHAVGSLVSSRGVVIKTELSGTVVDVAAVSGTTVSRGDLLVEIDTSTESAQLAGLEAQTKLAEVSLRRAKELRANGTNTPSDLDNAEATLSQTQAAVAQLRTLIAKKHIVAPFAGRLGIININPGQFLNAGDTVGVLECVDPIYTDFSLPQQELGRLAAGQTVRLTIDAYLGATFEGKITAINPRVDDASRSVDIRATLENKDERLHPGMYTRVEVILPTTERAMVIPWAAVVYNPYGETVYVVENGIAQQRFIKTGPQRGDLIMVREGLKPGEKVVTAGQIKLRNGSTVKIDNSVGPEANPAPKPREG